MKKKDFLKTLQADIVEMVAEYLTPVAMEYGYSDVPLENTIKWKPMVLVIGNYSSGKSSLINELIGGDIQATGQAPTDDSFTIITYDEAGPATTPVHVTEERDGKFLLNDPDYPFAMLKKYGQRFSSHICLKKVNAPFLENIAIIDTPGMHDSISEHDRGYNYQEIIGDLARIADIVLVFFDPHKAGTVREAHTSLKETLPKSTFEDRIFFVLNRIDECASLVDLLKVYGTLCWNLSQITGRKDIPTIHLTYSPGAAASSSKDVNPETDFMKYLDNEREALKQTILSVPKRRLDHMASFVETHSERLAHFLEALISYRKKAGIRSLKLRSLGVLASIFCSGLGVFILFQLRDNLQDNTIILSGVGCGMAIAVFMLWSVITAKFFTPEFHRDMLKRIDELTPLDSQTRQDSWLAIKSLVRSCLKDKKGHFSLKKVKQEYALVKGVRKKGCSEIRDALNQQPLK
ncbi:dynamin family protein [Desulfobacterales bacterium HSG16]|nr:dynamin family protein [Desulfobacterales bacterium HSG16]